MKDKKRNSAGRKALVVLCVILAVILLLAIAATIFVNSLLGKINRTTDPTGEQSGQTDPSVPKVNVLDEDILHILLIGQDRREGEGAQRSDSMILCTLNKEKKTLTMTSFMRDMYLEIPGYQDNRINVAYASGGMKLLDKTIQHNFGVTVSHNVEVDVFGFIDIIDMMGGIDMELTRQEAKYLNRWGNWDYTNDRDWTLQEGMNHLTGRQAVAFCRIREIGSDFERTARQRKVLTKVLSDIKSMGITKAYKLLEAVLPKVTTDMSDADILSYAWSMLPMLGDLEIVTQRIPADGTYTDKMIRGMAVLVPDLEANRKLLQETIQ